LTAAAKGLGVSVIDPDATNVRETSRNVTFDVKLPGETIKNLTVSLRGRHQAENACAALGAIDALRRRGYAIPLETIRKGMADVRWPGRLEYFGNVILDGAHNEPGVKALCRYCDDWLPKEKTVLLSGMMEDKDVAQMTKRLSGRVRCVVAAQPDVPRAMAADRLADRFAQHGAKAYAVADPKAALAKARALAGNDGIVLCAGSLYLIGALRTILREEKEFAHVI